MGTWSTIDRNGGRVWVWVLYTVRGISTSIMEDGIWERHQEWVYDSDRGRKEVIKVFLDSVVLLLLLLLLLILGFYFLYCFYGFFLLFLVCWWRRWLSFCMKIDKNDMEKMRSTKICVMIYFWKNFFFKFLFYFMKINEGWMKMEMREEEEESK